MTDAHHSLSPRILIVDDHVVVRRGLMALIEDSISGAQVCEVSSGFAALEYLRGHAADLVISDLTMPGMNGLELVRRLRLQWPTLRTLIVSMHAEEHYAVRAFKAGAHGFITKQSSSAEILEAITKVLAGGMYITGSVAETLVTTISGNGPSGQSAQLTDRELEVLRRLVSGERMTDIAQALHLSIKTVSTHKARMQEKLQLPSTSALLQYGLSLGLHPAHGWTQQELEMGSH